MGISGLFLSGFMLGCDSQLSDSSAQTKALSALNLSLIPVIPPHFRVLKGVFLTESDGLGGPGPREY